MNKKLWGILGIVYGFVFIISLIFDSFVSYHIFKSNPNFFMSHEANKYLVLDLSNNKSFLSSMFILMNFWLVFWYFIFYFMILNFVKNESTRNIISIFLLSFILFLSCLHFIGGFSWFLF